MDGPLPLDLFDYALPPERIAQEPTRPRDHSRLMVLGRHRGKPEHRSFRDLPRLLAPGDLLLVNRTRVIPARLKLLTPHGGKAELLLCRPCGANMQTATTWEAMGKPKRALQPGRDLITADGVRLRVLQRSGDQVTVRAPEAILAILDRLGEMPLPPYIQRPQGALAGDAGDYQTLFANEPGAVAAPTAALHFTPAILEALEARQVQRAELVLHVGPGTFLPVREVHAHDVRQHRMHQEWYSIPTETLAALHQTQERGGRVVAVGTTSLRALETWARTGEPEGDSSLFIYPGVPLRVIDGLVTNFHLPRSTLLMLVSALVGRERLLQAYQEALAEQYRFFSYGDAMVVL